MKLSQDLRELRMSRRLGPYGGHPQSQGQLQAHLIGALKAEGTLQSQVEYVP